MQKSGGVCSLTVMHANVWAVLTFGLILGAIGCGSGGASSPINAIPVILTQPADVTAKVGETATFSVVAQGTGALQYQWYRSGTAIPSATSPSYTTSVLVTSDLKSEFSVAVSNSSGQVTSRQAQLVLGPRSPMEGDLRFQQVASALSAPGYVGIANGTVNYPSTMAQVNGWGTPLSLGPGCGLGALSAQDCRWIYFTFTRPGLNGWGAGYTNQQASALDFFVGSMPDSEVMNGVSINRTLNNAAFSVVGRTDASGFAVTKKTVPVSELAASLSAAGASGAVPTAISPDNGNVTFYAYTWKSDHAVYDVELRQTYLPGLVPALTELAQWGFIITASGGDSNGVYLVGTKVHGDALPRQVLFIQGGQSPQPLADGGYSPVIIVPDSLGNVLLYVGEK